MMVQSLRKIMKSKPDTDPGYLFHTNLTYPTFPDNTSNFIEDYQDNAESFNRYAILKRGDQVVKFDEEDYEDGWDFLSEVSEAITDVHLESWARLYYALSLSYNPLYNVDGTTTRETTQRQRTDAYGAQSGSSTFGATSQTDNWGATSQTDNWGAISKTDQYGNKSATLGAHTDTQTNSSVSFDSGTEKETGQTQNSFGSQTNTEASYTDTHSELAKIDTHSELAKSDTHTGAARNDSHSENAHSDTHTDSAFSETETRQGNIGVTMSQQLLEAEWKFRQKSFFETIINQMLDEAGFFYNGGIGL